MLEPPQPKEEAGVRGKKRIDLPVNQGQNSEMSLEQILGRKKGDNIHYCPH